MEDTNVKARPYRVEDHYKNNLTDGPSYYRVRLDSDWRQVPNGSIADAYFDVSQVFPNHRKDLLKGNWEVHLESFHGYFQNLILDAATLTQIERGDTQSIFVALPDMIQSSNDWVVTETGCRQAHVLCQIPIKPMLSDVSVAIGPFNPTPAPGANLALLVVDCQVPGSLVAPGLDGDDQKAAWRRPRCPRAGGGWVGRKVCDCS